jgi:hypothetical protein
MSKSYKTVAKRLRTVLSEGCELTRSLLTMYRCGSDFETREMMEECYQDLWTLAARISRTLRVKTRVAKRRRRKLAPPEPAEAHQVEPAEANKGKPKRRQRKKELFERLKNDNGSGPAPR